MSDLDPNKVLGILATLIVGELLLFIAVFILFVVK